MGKKLTYSAFIHGGLEVRRVTVSGRPAWLLLCLLRAGRRGITTLENPAPRISHYLFVLRKQGFVVSTDYESHTGTFGGTHGRFRLLDTVRVAGGTLDDYLASPDGRREFPDASFARAAA